MFRNYFAEIWELHPRILNGVLYRDITNLGYADLVSSPVPGEYFNYAIPIGTDPSQLNISDLKQRFAAIKEKVCIYLLEEHLQSGFVEYLIRQGFKFEGRDSWMGYDKNTYRDSNISSTVVEVTSDMFVDYKFVSESVFSDFPGNETYIEICRRSLEGVNSIYPDLKSELYLIYDEDKPAANGGMFYSKEQNFAYLHDAGTLEQYRGRGYQSSLIKYRVNKAVGLGIDRIFSSVDHGGKSWSNTIKCGLNNMHTGMMFLGME